jgi:hypothetical protein
MTTYYDLCLTWCWEFDADFTRLFVAACQQRGLSVLQVTHAGLAETIVALESDQISFSAFLDRTEYEAPFEPIFQYVHQSGIFWINPRETAFWAEDKATMHLELLTAGLNTPFTIILPPYQQQQSLPALDISPLGARFVIKPTFGGGGQGVLMDATSFEQVLERRTEFPHLKYLLQETITPQRIQDRDAWFRVIYCAGECFPCWWDPHTHIYSLVTSSEEESLGLAMLCVMIQQIAALARLEFFSTEIALNAAQQWVVVDYVNDQIDMRLQSQAQDGVPDAVVLRVTELLAGLVEVALRT